MSENNEGTPETKHKQPRHRSRAYPVIDLAAAMERAQALHGQERFQSIPVEIVLKHWNYEKSSSKGMRVLAALIQYGLLDVEGTGSTRKVRLSELARVAMNHPEPAQRKAALREAALKPTLYEAVHEKHSGKSDAAIRWELTASGALNETAVDAFISNFRSTMAFSGAGDSVILSGTGGDKPKDEPPKDPFQKPLDDEMPEVQFQESKPYDMSIMLPTGEEMIVRMPRKQKAATYDYMVSTLNTQLDLARPGITGEQPEVQTPDEENDAVVGITVDERDD